VVRTSNICGINREESCGPTGLLFVLKQSRADVICAQAYARLDQKISMHSFSEEENFRNHTKTHTRALYYSVKQSPASDSLLLIFIFSGYCYYNSFSKWFKPLCFLHQSYFVKYLLEHEFRRKIQYLIMNIYLYIIHASCLYYIDIILYKYFFSF